MTARLAALPLAVLCGLTPFPLAAAVAPAAVDAAALPRPAAPSPPAPTERVEQCRTPATTQDGGTPVLTAAAARVLWRLSRGAGQTVAVIDTGVARHRLLPRLVPGGDYVSSGDGTQDCDAHGTMVAGLVAGVADGGFAGIAPEATILSIRQSSATYRVVGDGEAGVGDVRTMAQAVRTAADAGATVVNVSSVACGPADEAMDDRALGAALAYAVDVKNVVVVVAAGNAGGSGGSGGCGEQNPVAGNVPDWAGVRTVASPSWYDDYVLTVGAVDREGRPADFSLAGPWVDVAAPGRDLVSLAPSGDGLVGGLSGTSYAAPVVAGLAAVIRARSPELSARQVMARIEATAIRPAAGWDPRVGNGVVDPVAAVGGAAAPPPPAAPATLGHPATAPPAGGATGAYAYGGAAVCAAAVTAWLLAAGARSRRRVDGQRRVLDGEFGSTG